MTVTLSNLHAVENPEEHLAQAARTARRQARNGGTGRLIVRAPDRQTDGVRVFTVDDVGRMLQREGRILEIGVTEGGSIVAAVDPIMRRGTLAIWTGYAIGPWHPSDITLRGLGGSETAAVRLAEEFAAMNYTVTLYGQFEQDGLVDDITLRDFSKFDPTQHVDVLVGFRDARLFDHRPNAGFTALWLEDLPGPEFLTRERAENIDRICAVSYWHACAMQNAYPWLRAPVAAGTEAKLVACRNGITHRFFEYDESPERQRRVIYSSSPDRGADIMLDIWPQIREAVPDAELVLTYSRWYDIVARIYKKSMEHRRAMVARIDELKDQGVSRIEDGMGQKALAHLMLASTVWAHPSWWSGHENDDGTSGTQFHETSCISAMEAQAAGLVVVASNWGALTETVQHGTLIDGDPREKDGQWRALFADAIIRGLTDEQTQMAAQFVGPEMVRDMDWRGAAEQLASYFPATVAK